MTRPRPRKLISIGVAAKILGVSTQTARIWALQGRLPVAAMVEGAARTGSVLGFDRALVESLACALTQDKSSDSDTV